MATPVERVREEIGEVIPAGGAESDTMFTDDQIQAWIDEEETLNEAIARGWRAKAAQYADLVDTAEGTSKRSMSDLSANALRMAASFSGATGAGVPERTTRLRPIVRR